MQDADQFQQINPIRSAASQDFSQTLDTSVPESSIENKDTSVTGTVDRETRVRKLMAGERLNTTPTPTVDKATEDPTAPTPLKRIRRKRNLIGKAPMTQIPEEKLLEYQQEKDAITGQENLDTANIDSKKTRKAQNTREHLMTATSLGLLAGTATNKGVEFSKYAVGASKAATGAAAAAPVISTVTGGVTALMKIGGIGNELRGFKRGTGLKGGFFKSYNAFTSLGKKWIDFVRGKKWRRIGARSIGAAGAGLGIAAGAVVLAGSVASGGLLPLLLGLGGAAVGVGMAIAKYVRNKRAQKKKDRATLDLIESKNGPVDDTPSQKINRWNPKNWGKKKNILKRRQQKNRRRKLLESASGMDDVKVDRKDRLNPMNWFKSKSKILDDKRLAKYQKDNAGEIGAKIGEQKKEGKDKPDEVLSKGSVASGISETLKNATLNMSVLREINTYKRRVLIDSTAARDGVKNEKSKLGLDAEYAASLLNLSANEAAGTKGYKLLESRMSVTNTM